MGKIYAELVRADLMSAVFPAAEGPRKATGKAISIARFKLEPAFKFH